MRESAQSTHSVERIIYNSVMEFYCEKVEEGITRIQTPCKEFVYLIEGDEKAVLIDTGSGVGSLKQTVEKCTSLPVIVLVTHGHVDHAMGAGEFEEVYMNHDDKYIFDEHGREQFRIDGIMHSAVREDFSKEKDYIVTPQFNHFKDLSEGDIFELGNVSIEIYGCPGHTKGSLVMLIPEKRILITGDAANDATFLFEHYSLSIKEYRKSLVSLIEKTKGRYDRVLTSHHSGEVDSRILEGLVELCDEIISRNTDDMELPFPASEKGYFAKAIEGPSMKRVDGGIGNIVYNLNYI